MIVSLETLKTRIHGVVLNKGEQGHVIDGLISKLESLPESYDELLEFANGLSDLPVRADWLFRPLRRRRRRPPKPSPSVLVSPLP